VTRWSALVDAVARWSTPSGADDDPDQVALRRSVADIGLRVALVTAALVVSVIALVVVYVLWQLTPEQQNEASGPADVHITLDTLDLSIAVLGVGGIAVVLAGFAAWVIARRAVRPLAEAARVQRTFVADASHELRTPLAVLHARVQQLARLTPDTDPRRPVVDALGDDSRVLIAITEDLLEVAAGRHDPTAVADLVTELDAVRRDLAVLAGDQDVRLEVQPADATIAMPATHLRRCLVALVDNALGHARPGGTVQVSVDRAGNDVVVHVRDDGPGITGIDPERVFDRFAHGTPTVLPGRTGTRTGYGIGLALVREVVVRAGGSVAVASTGPTGTDFALRLPTAEASR
jgi:two-component system OmpR family sensor kinase